MGNHSWRQVGIGMMVAVLICAVATCAMLGSLVHQRGVAAFGVDQDIGSVRVLGYTTWNAHCPPFTGCEPTTQQSYVV